MGAIDFADHLLGGLFGYLEEGMFAVQVDPANSAAGYFAKATDEGQEASLSVYIHGADINEQVLGVLGSGRRFPFFFEVQAFILEVRLVITVARSLSDVQEEEALQRDGQTAAPTPQESHLLVLENAILELGKQQLAILEELKQGRKPAPDPELELSLNGNGQHSGN